MIELLGALAVIAYCILDGLGLFPATAPTTGRGNRKRLKGCNGDGYGSRRNNCQ